MQTADDAVTKTVSARPWLDAYEQRIWGNFYRRIRDPAIATEVVRLMEADADLKRGSPGLYLCAKATLGRRLQRQVTFNVWLRAFGRITRIGPYDSPDQAVSEKALWERFYRKVEDPIVAQEIVEYLDKYSWRHEGVSGLYMQARQTLRRQQQRRDRWATVARFIRQLLVGDPKPVSMAVNAAATERAEHLAESTDFADARSAFDREAAGSGRSSQSAASGARTQTG